MTAATKPVLVPVGHLLGTFYEGPAGGRRSATVQLGGALHDLDDGELATWWLTHSLADRAPEPWTAAALSAAAVELGLPVSAPVLRRLVERGLVVEVVTGGPAALEFARSFRLVPQMLGLGNSPQAPAAYQIGLFGRPVIDLPDVLYDVWRWATVEAHLWNSCRGAADVARAAGLTDPDALDPELLLDVVLQALHPLLAAQAAHVDTRRPAPTGGSAGG